MKKKSIKIAAATAVAASGIVAAAPFQSHAATNVISTVDHAVMQMQKAYHTYSDVTANGQFANMADVYKEYNAAKVAYSNGKAAVIKAGGTNKDAYLAKLDSNYNELIAKRVVTYIDAYNYAKSLETLKNDLSAALAAKDWDNAEAGYHKISYELKTRTVILDRVYGKTTRELLRSSFKASAQDLRDSIAQQVTAKMALVEAGKAIDAKDVDAAKKQLDKANNALKLADQNSEFTKDLAAKFATANTSYAALVSPAVVSATGVDAKTIEVKFSSPVDAKTLQDGNKNDLITLTAKTGAQAPGAVTQELSEDGKTLTLTAANFFKGDYTVNVPFEQIKGTTGKFLAAVNQAVNVNDTTAPVLVSAKATVKATTDKVTSVTLSFNEEVQSGLIVKINGQGFVGTANGKTVTINNLSLDASKAYDVTVINAKDAVNNTKEEQSIALTIAVDNIAPSVAAVEATGENTVKVTLDKALAGNLDISAKVGTFATNIVTKIEQNTTNTKEYFVTLNEAYLYPSADVTSATVTFTVAKEALVDSIGNKNAAEITKQVILSKDTVAPSVTKVETTAPNGKTTAFTVNYSEDVQSVNTSKVYVVNSKGEIVSLGSLATPAIDSKDAKKVVFTLLPGVKAETYSLDLSEGFVTDKSLNANKSAKYSFNVTVTDPAQPTVTTYDIASASAANNKIMIDFGQKVKATGTGSALNPASYSVNGVVLPADTKIEFGTSNGALDQNKVIVTLPEGFIVKNDDYALLRINGVQTIDSKTNNPFMQTIKVTDNTAPVVQSFVATDLSTLTLGYSEAVKLVAETGKSVDVTDEIALFDSKGAAITVNSASVTADGKLVLVLNGSAASVVKVTALATKGNADIVDNNGVAQKSGITLTK